jgi:hypothetical protein
MKLNKEQRQAILDILDDMFNDLKARMLGRFFKGPSIYFQVVKQTDPIDTLEGLYNYTIAHMFSPSAKVNEEDIEHLSDITANYIDAKKLQVANRIMHDVMQAETWDEALKSIKDHFADTTSYLKTLLNTETRITQAYAEKEGIQQVAQAVGVDDPVVAKLGVIDDKMCENCRKLWHLESNIRVPKVYKMSELAEGYNKDYKNPIPTLGPTHPNCRHILTFIPPNFGFNEFGRIEFKSLNYNVWEDQRKNQK